MSSSICDLETGLVRAGDPGERILLSLVEELLTVGVGPRETLHWWRWFPTTRRPTMSEKGCVSRSPGRKPMTQSKWVISAELNTEAVYRVWAGGSSSQLRGAHDSPWCVLLPSSACLEHLRVGSLTSAMMEHLHQTPQIRLLGFVFCFSFLFSESWFSSTSP